MSNKTEAYTIGFVGIDCYDIIHYLARILCKLQKKVLLVDQSTKEALTYSVPIPKDMDLSNIITYRQVDFTRAYRKDMLEEYDYIFMNFGDNKFCPEIEECEDLFIVTDQQGHNAAALSTYFEKQRKQSITAIIRNVVKCKIKPEFIIKLMEMNPDESPYYVMDADPIDQQLMLSCQYDQVFRFKKLSPNFKKMLYEILIDKLKFDIKEVKQAFKKAEKGK